jgi:hypothetical protein
MQRGMGTLAMFAVLLAGARFTSAPSPQKTSEKPAGAAAEYLTAGPQPKETSCSEFVNKGEKGATPGELAALVDRYLDKVSGSKPAQGKLPPDTLMMIATVPDPLHTHLNLQFDRSIEALQQAAQDQHFTYDSSWLPWKAQTTEYSSRTDQEQEEAATRKRELCPGLILFRKSIHSITEGGGGYEDTYAGGLFVFVVAEQPTTGLNRTQWDNARVWIENHVDVNSKPSYRTLRVLGPTFSGSVPSVIRALSDLQTQNSPFTNVLLYTGTVRGCSSYAWLKHEVSTFHKPPVRTEDFDQNDLIQIDHYFQFLQERGHEVSEVAILSEDETAYGGLPISSPTKPDTPEPTCEPNYAKEKPLYLFYPRDISAVRSAYQEQSIFAPAPAGSESVAHTVLQPQPSQSAHIDTDTIPSFSGTNAALAQEAELYGVIDSLKAHGIRFVILRSTNTLDYLFLTRFLHRAYPEAFIVTMGPDILFGRDVDSPEFRGVASLSAYPLLPRGQDWTSEGDSTIRHAHRIFGSDAMEGTYLAARFLIPDNPDANPEDPSDSLHNKSVLPDYGPPFWAKGKREPVTWLSIVGRDGYWPVALLQEKYSPDGKNTQDLVSNLQPMKDSVPAPAPTGLPTDLMRFSLSPAWKLCCAMMTLAICMHLLACCCLWKSQDLSMFVQFTPLPGDRQLFLMGVGWAVICSAVILMLRCSAPLWDDLEGRNHLWIVILGVAVCLGLLGIAWDMGARVLRAPPSTPLDWLRVILLILFPLLLFAIALVVGRALFNDMPTAYRAVHLASGVSPVSSLLLLLGGFYWWFWQTLSGLALLSEGRPILPRSAKTDRALARISSKMAEYIEAFAVPLPRLCLKTAIVYVFPFVIITLLVLALMRPFGGNFDSMLHSFENKSFNLTLHLMLAIAVYLLLLECAQLLGTWLALKRLLLALNRTPLRRTFSALQGLSMHSLWSLSGTTSRARYTIFSHQLESLFHLRNLLASEARDVGNQKVRDEVRDACAAGERFLVDRAIGADLAMLNNPKARRTREQVSQCTECVIKEILLRTWRTEAGTLDLAEDGRQGHSQEVLPLSEDVAIRRAEEFVCLIYVGYLQNLLARMRTMVLAIVGLYAALALSLAFYPYTPRPAIVLALLLLLLVLGSAVALVYAGLDRDSTLSQITNTEPGTLGLNFWLRLASFIGVPLVGLLVAQFPEIADFVASWIQPSLNAVK